MGRANAVAIARAVKLYGITTNPADAAFILPDGRLLAWMAGERTPPQNNRDPHVWATHAQMAARAVLEKDWAEVGEDRDSRIFERCVGALGGLQGKNHHGPEGLIMSICARPPITDAQMHALLSMVREASAFYLTTRQRTSPERNVQLPDLGDPVGRREANTAIRALAVRG